MTELPEGIRLLASLVYALVLCGTGAGITLVIVRGRKLTGHVLAGFLGMFWLRVCIVLLNETYDLFPPKGAGNWALEVYQQILTYGSLDGLLDYAAGSPFFVQGLVNVPGFLLFGASRLNLLLMNAFLGAFVAVVAAAYLERIGPERSAVWGFWLFSLYPAAINFSFFGLREPAVVLFVTVYALSGVLVLFRPQLSMGSRLRHAALALAALLPILSLRLELLPILLLLPAWWMVVWIWRGTRRFLTGFETWFSRVALAVCILAALVPAAVGIYRITIAEVGTSRLVNPVDFIERYSAVRYARAVGEGAGGGGSHIVPTETYENLPTGGAVALQVVGLIVLPLPWLLTDPTRWLAFGDSLVVIWCLWMVWRWGRRVDNSLKHGAVTPLMFCFLVGILAMGLVVVNAGNGFRMRLSLIPFLLIPTALAFEKWLSSCAAEKGVAGTMEGL